MLHTHISSRKFNLHTIIQLLHAHHSLHSKPSTEKRTSYIHTVQYYNINTKYTQPLTIVHTHMTFRKFNLHIILQFLHTLPSLYFIIQHRKTDMIYSHCTIFQYQYKIYTTSYSFTWTYVSSYILLTYNHTISTCTSLFIFYNTAQKNGHHIFSQYNITTSIQNIRDKYLLYTLIIM